MGEIMFRLGKASRDRLATCHSDWHLIVFEVLKDIDVSVFCGFRDKTEQNNAFLDGKSQLQWPDSKHNKRPSLAIDMGPYFAELKNTSWEDSKAFANFAGYVQATAKRLYREGKIKHLVRWGGDWDMDGRTLDQKFHDLPHFELVRP